MFRQVGLLQEKYRQQQDSNTEPPQSESTTLIIVGNLTIVFLNVENLSKLAASSTWKGKFETRETFLLLYLRVSASFERCHIRAWGKWPRSESQIGPCLDHSPSYSVGMRTFRFGALVLLLSLLAATLSTDQGCIQDFKGGGGVRFKKNVLIFSAWHSKFSWVVNLRHYPTKFRVSNTIFCRFWSMFRIGKGGGGRTPLPPLDPPLQTLTCCGLLSVQRHRVWAKVWPAFYQHLVLVTCFFFLKERILWGQALSLFVSRRVSSCQYVLQN